MRIHELLEFIDRKQLKSIERDIDSKWLPQGIDVDFTGHFLDRANDPRNIKDIEPEEILSLFHKELDTYKNTIAKIKNDEVVFVDTDTDINAPVAVNTVPRGDEKPGKHIIAKTVMRKKNFSSPNKKLVVPLRRPI